jgi:hypothetical protein
MVQDARQRTKVFLDTYLTATNMLWDDGVTALTTITTFADPDYPFLEVMYGGKNVDVVFSIDQSMAEPKVDWDGTIYGYREQVPITLYAVTKQGRAGPKILWQGEAELRRIVETNPTGSYRSIRRVASRNQALGDGTLLHSVEYVLTYDRDTT